MNDVIGGAWLARNFHLDLAVPLPKVSRIGGRRSTHVDEEGRSQETFVEALRPEPTLRGHLTFHLKHEVPSFELLSRLFRTLRPDDLAEWVRAEPTGQYARRAGFLYEWFTGNHVPVEDVPLCNYAAALDEEELVVASPDQVTRSRRWRVLDNMPGTPSFCPFLRRTRKVVSAMELDVPQLLGELREEFGEELLMRSAVWMTLRESKSSFVIEGEGDRATRIQRFASVIGRRTGTGEVPLSEEDLATLQAEILGERTSLKHFGLRRSPVFVGESVRFQDVVHYIAPPPEALADMLTGLREFLRRTTGQSPVMRAAVASFGFVYIHPLADGNGRVHRFLINDILRRDGVVQDPLIVPISSLITSDQGERRAYDRVLEAVSRPLMEVLSGHFSFGASIVYPDGLSSNLHVADPNVAAPVWRMPELTPHVVYMSSLIARTIREDMREESRYLRSHSRAREAIKDVIEMPDAQVDRVIRSIESNQGKLTNALAKEIPALEAEGVWEAVQDALRDAFEDGPVSDAVERYRHRT